MRMNFADSRDVLFAAAIDVVRIIGKVVSSDKTARTLVGRVKEGIDHAWEPVSIRVNIEVHPDCSALHAVAEQTQRDGLPDQRGKALDVFATHIKRRKDLTILD